MCKNFNSQAADLRQSVELRPKTYMRVSGFSSEKARYGRSALSFYFIETFYIEIAVFTTFSPSPFVSIFDSILLKIHNKMFRVGATGRNIPVCVPLDLSTRNGRQV